MAQVIQILPASLPVPAAAGGVSAAVDIRGVGGNLTAFLNASDGDSVAIDGSPDGATLWTPFMVAQNNVTVRQPPGVVVGFIRVRRIRVDPTPGGGPTAPNLSLTGQPLPSGYTFDQVALPVPAADGVGAAVSVAQLGITSEVSQSPTKAIAASNFDNGDQLIVEGSTDGNAPWVSAMQLQPLSLQPFPGSFGFLRVRRQRIPAAGPRIGVDGATCAFMGQGVTAAGGAIDITSFGADPSGVASSTAAIQAAINATPPGGKLIIPTGTFRLAGAAPQLLTIANPINVEGAGWGAILLVDAAVDNATDVFHLNGAAAIVGVRFAEFTIQPTTPAGVAVTAATNATPIQITANGHGLATGGTVRIAGVGGNTNANGTYKVTVVDANNFTLTGSVGNAAYTAGGTSTKLPGRHAFNLDVTNGFTLQNIKIDHVNVQQLGGRAIVTTNPTPVLNGVFLVDVRDSILFGGVNLSKAGDSILFKGDTVSGGFNGFDVDLVQGVGNPLGGGAHLLVIEDCNCTSQGAWVRAVAGSQMRLVNNNVEPGATGGAGIDTSNAPNGAVLDLDGTVTAPLVLPLVRGNYIANWSNNGANGDCIRVNFARGALLTENNCARSAAGPFSYRVTANAIATCMYIPVTDDGNIPATLVADLGAQTMTRFANISGADEFGATSSKSYNHVIRGGSAQAGDILAVKTNAGANLIQIPATGDVCLGGAADAGFPVQLAATLMSGRLEAKAGLVLNRTTVADINYAALQADVIIAYTALTAGRTVTLPAAPRVGTWFLIKNESAGAFAITITPASGLIDGLASVATTAAAHAPAIRCYWDGVNWNTV